MLHVSLFRWPCLAIALAVAMLPAGLHAADSPSSADRETAAEKLRKALAQPRELQIHDQPLDAAVNQLREQTSINFAIDQAAVPANPVNVPGGNAVVVQVGAASPYAHLKVSAPVQNMPLRAALTKMLRGHKLTHVIAGDTVLITTVERAVERQLSQPVSLNVEAAPMAGVLKRLARDTGANLLLDPRTAKEGQTALTLRLDEVPLETAVHLLADEAGLRAVRLDNVLYVTTEARAEKLRKARPPVAAAPPGGWQVWPDGNGNFRLIPPAGQPGNVGGMAGIGGLGGIAGIGGGALGAVGMAGLGGVAPPMPLTPPLPGKKDAPAKPKDEAKPTKPGVGPGGDSKPAPKDKPAAEAIRPRPRSPRSRRRTI